MSRSRKLHSIPALLLAFIVLMGLLQPASWVTAAESASVPSFCGGTVKIMPLGDSITVGKSSGAIPDSSNYYISYRKDLWTSLTDYGYSFDFVGSQTSGQAVFGDPQHEGHGGYRDDQVAVEVYDWLDTNPADIVLLHIGTNALTANEGDVEDILDNIDRYETDSGTTIWVILARIINRISYSSTTTTFNNNVQTMAETRIAAGDKIVIVDMENGADLIYNKYDEVPPGDMWDDLHPYYTGYAKMASVWKDGIDQVFVQACNPPSVTNPGDQSNAEGEIIDPLQIIATDPEEQPLIYSQTGLPPNLEIDSASGLIQGTISYEAYTGTPYNVTVTVTDPDNNQVSVDFTWTITNTNRPPQVVQPTDQTNMEGDSVYLQIFASDPDIGDTWEFSASDLPLGLVLDQGNGWIYGNISYEAYMGTPNLVQVTAKDSGSPILSDSKTFVWTIVNVNRSPVFDVLPEDQSDEEGEAVSLQIQASDPDGDNPLSYAASGLPEGLSIHPSNGLIGGILFYNASDGSPHPVSVTVSDGSEQETANFTWQVTNHNRAPQVSDPGSQTDAEKDSITLQMQASDPDPEDLITFSLGSGSLLPAGLQLDPNTGEISGTIEEGASAISPYWVTVIVKDSGSPQLAGQVSFTWNVVPHNQPHGNGINVFLPLVIH